jgi:DNA-binding NarL/FixJ family response regulator
LGGVDQSNNPVGNIVGERVAEYRAQKTSPETWVKVSIPAGTGARRGSAEQKFVIAGGSDKNGGMQTEPVKRKVFIVDDHQLFREGLAQLINREADLVVCGEAEGVESAMAGIRRSVPDMAIIDISLAGGNGIDLIKSLRAEGDKLPLLVLSMHDESLYAERALRAGANGFVMKQEANKCVKDGIRRVLDGEVYLSERISARMLSKFVSGKPAPSASPLEKLSQRELEVFQLIGQGYSTRQIADELHLTIPTINSFRARIKEKLGLPNANELVMTALQWVQTRQLKVKA